MTHRFTVAEWRVLALMAYDHPDPIDNINTLIREEEDRLEGTIADWDIYANGRYTAVSNYRDSLTTTREAYAAGIHPETWEPLDDA